ncbi:MAG TPA: hypothetical protein VLV86_18730, partial [Vicinamibacterales bacterium]|nr:hypothetical protein [Vicinamibacterales bacterium]
MIGVFRVRSVVACLALVALAGEAGGQTRTIKWPKALSASDRRDVLTLAKQMGIDDPARVALQRVLILGDRYLSIESAEVENGHEISWTRAFLARLDWHEYDDWPPEDRSTHVGRWFAKGPAERETKWRIRDGAWRLDVGFLPDESIPFEDAERVILAIRGGRLLNRQPERTSSDVTSQPSIPSFD